jgi:hypothetical protein
MEGVMFAIGIWLGAVGVFKLAYLTPEEISKAAIICQDAGGPGKIGINNSVTCNNGLSGKINK